MPMDYLHKAIQFDPVTLSPNDLLAVTAIEDVEVIAASCSVTSMNR